MIYFTSDLHFCHDREFLYQPRGFDSVYKMNEAIVKNWNEIVQPEDDVYVLGDLMLNNNVTGLKLIKSLKGNIHVILGNHDTTEREDLYNTCYNIVSINMAERLKYDKYHFFLCHYPTLCGNYDDGKGLRKHMISLCGHTHTKDKFADWDKGLIYHVELDAHNMRPVPLDKIIEDIKIEYEKGL